MENERAQIVKTEVLAFVHEVCSIKDTIYPVEKLYMDECSKKPHGFNYFDLQVTGLPTQVSQCNVTVITLELWKKDRLCLHVGNSLAARLIDVISIVFEFQMQCYVIFFKFQ